MECDDNMKEFVIDCVFTVHDIRTVKAKSKKEALEKAEHFEDIKEFEQGQFEDFISATVVD